MNRAEHCKECLEKLGRDWNEVHAWLDAAARDYYPWMGHRQMRHHDQGIEEVRKLWGDRAAEAAKLHILADEGRVPTVSQIRGKYGPSPFADDNGEYPTYPNKRPEGWSALGAWK